MKTVEVNIAGGSYQHKSLPLSAQRTVNFWAQKQPADKKEKSQYILESWHGKTLFGTVSGGINRGMFEHLDILYKVTGTTLYTVSSTGVHTSRGTITGAERCIFTGIGINLVIISEGIAYFYDGAAFTVTVISDIDLESPQSATTLNNQVIYDGDGGRFGVSDVGDATSINSLNYATAESEPDSLVRVYAFNQILFLMGEKTIEPWWNSGNGNPPFGRIEGGIINAGLAALHSVAHDDDNIYFLRNGHEICAMRGSSSAVLTTISTPPMAKKFKEYVSVSDAIGWTIKIDSQWFYIITFPTANKTWALPIGGEWFELASGVNDRDVSDSYAYCFRKHLVADYRNGNIYELSNIVYDDNGEAIIRLRDSAPIHGGAVNAPGKSLEMNRFELIMETGVGILSGQGSNPVVMLSTSDDGGNTFSTEMFGTIGKLGEFQYKVEWFGLGSFYQRIIRVRTSDPVYYSIHSAAADLSVGI